MPVAVLGLMATEVRWLAGPRPVAVMVLLVAGSIACNLSFVINCCRRIFGKG